MAASHTDNSRRCGSLLRDGETGRRAIHHQAGSSDYHLPRRFSSGGTAASDRRTGGIHTVARRTLLSVKKSLIYQP